MKETRDVFAAAPVLPRTGCKTRTWDILRMNYRRSKIKLINCSILRYLDGSTYPEAAQAALERSGSLCERPLAFCDLWHYTDHGVVKQGMKLVY